MNDSDYMNLAIDAARKAIEKGQSPFGACIVKDGQVLAVEHNSVWCDCDITAHAEVSAIRKACSHICNIDLSGAVIYSTTEPCPMCFSAIHWARISKIFYGTNIADAKRYGFNELEISNQTLKTLGGEKIQIHPDFLRQECLKLFEEFKSKGLGKTY